LVFEYDHFVPGANSGFLTNDSDFDGVQTQLRQPRIASSILEF
jgi:hypothetical protein